MRPSLALAQNMSKVLITGSTDGIGLLSAQLLASQGHTVYLHARNADRAATARAAVPQAAGVLIGDLTSLNATKHLAAEANKLSTFDAVIHNAGVGLSASDSLRSPEAGLAGTFAANSLAPYVLTALMKKPKRLLFLSSSMHFSGDDSLEDVAWMPAAGRKFVPSTAYCDTKLQDVLLAFAFARRFKDDGVQVAALDPGWVKTKMGGAGAPGTTQAPAEAIAQFAAGDAGSVVAGKTGVYFTTSGVAAPHTGTLSEERQDRFLRICEELSGVKVPE